MKSQLLPEGFRDGLPDLSELEYEISSIFLDLMNLNGYMLVKPPLLEFENSLFFLTKENENINSFRVMDPLTQKYMGIRSDITMQIARLSCGTLSQSNRPLRLCYTGEILKVKNNSVNLSRQFTQIGAEIIGVEKNYCLDEVITLVIELLKKIKIKKFIFNFYMPDLINVISKDYNLSSFSHEKLVNSYRNKNINDLKNISQDLFEVSQFLLSLVGKFDENTENKLKNNLPKNIKREVLNFIKHIKEIKGDFSDCEIIIDPLEIDETDYHTGFCFKVYSEDSKELFSGGGYKVEGQDCFGFSGFLENFTADSSIRKKKIKKILIPYDLSCSEKINLQKKKMITVKATKEMNKKQLYSEAKKQKCQYLYFKKSILKVG